LNDPTQPEATACSLEDPTTANELERQLFLAGEWESLAQLYRERGKSETVRRDSLATIDVHLRRGQILEERVCDPEQAIEAYWRVAQLAPDHAVALRQLRRLLARREDWSAVQQIVDLEDRADLAPHQRAASLTEIAEMTRTAFGDLESASVRFERALAIDENQLDALAGLARTRDSQGRPRDAARLWERVVDRQRGPDRAHALISLGRVLEGPLEQHSRAAECFRLALTDDPRNTDAIDALIQDTQRREQWPLLSDLLDRRFELADSEHQRSEIALVASRLQLERFDSPAAARPWLGRARELMPEDARIDLLAADIERRAGNRPALLLALERIVGRTGSPDLAALLEAAELCREGDDDERAVEHLERAVLVAPTDSAVATQLDQALRRLCRDGERVAVLERRIALADSDSARAELTGEIAHLQEEVLEDVEAARLAWQRCFAFDPRHPEATDELVTRLTQAEAWVELRDVLERASESGCEETRPASLCALGDLYRLRFNDRAAAASAYERAIDLDPLTSPAVRGLAQIAETSDDDGAIAQSYAREAEITSDRGRLATLVWELVRVHDARDETAAALGWLERLRQVAPDDRACLEAIVTRHERHDDLAHADRWNSALEALQATTSGEQRVGSLNRLVALQQRLGNRAAAIGWAEESLDAAPQQVDIGRELVELYRCERRDEDRARLQRELADQLVGDERTACLTDLATLLADSLGDLDGAIAALRRAATASDGNAGPAGRLTDLLERTGRYEELADHLLEQSAQRPEGDSERRSLALRRAQLLLEPLGRFEEATNEYRRLHDADRTCPDALEGLERALRAGRDTAGLVELLAERAAGIEEPAERRRIEFQRAVVLEQGGAPFDETHAAYAALADQDDDPVLASEAHAQLEELLEQNGAWRELRERLEASLQRHHHGTELAVRERLAALCRDQLADAAGACEHLEAAAALAPTRPQLWQALALLYDAESRTDDLRRVIAAELACELEPGREIALRHRAGRLFASHDAKLACEHYERICELQPGHAEASEFLIDHYGEAGEHARLVELLIARLADSCAKPVPVGAGPESSVALAQRTALRLRIAALQADSLDDLDAAIATLEPALVEQAGGSVVAEPLADLLQRGDRNVELIELCRTIGNTEPDPAERARWQMRLADTFRSAGRTDEAVEAYRALDGATPVSEAARAALQSLYRELDRPEPLVGLLEQQLRTPPPAGASGIASPDATAIRMELAGLYAERLARPTEAIERLREVLAVDPSHAGALSRALELAEQHGSPEALEELLGLGLAVHCSRRKRASLLRRRAQLRVRSLARPEQAIEDLREALAIDADDLAAHSALREVYQQLERWPAALDCLYAEARLSPPANRGELLDTGAALAHEHLGADAALPWLERLRSERPDDFDTLARIAEIHRQAARPEPLLRTLDQQIALSGDPETRRSLHADRARILEHDLVSPGRARAALDAANAAAPGDPDVLANLARLCGRLGSTRQQVTTLEQLIDVVAPGERHALHQQCAERWMELVEHDRARSHFEAALATAPDEPQRAQLLERLGASLWVEGRISEWIGVAERELLARSEGEERAVALREALARTYTDALGAHEKALGHWLALAQWAACDDSGCASEQRDTIEQQVLAGLRRLHSPIELETRLTDWLVRHPDDSDTWLELAQLREEVLHSATGAAHAYRWALASEPDRLDALRGLRRVAERCGAFDEVADTLDRELEQRGDASDAERGELLRRLGAMAWAELGDGPRAERALSGALEIDPGDLSALHALQELHESRLEHAAALDLYERECALLGERDPERRMACWLRAGDLARRANHEPMRALAAYEAASTIGQLPEAREREWAELLLSCQEPVRYSEVFAAWCDRDDSPAVARDHLTLADQLDELAQRTEALERTRTATRRESQSLEAWDALAGRCRDTQETAEALERAAQLCAAGEACSRYAAAALTIETDDPRRALGWLELAVAADPGDTSAQAHLARVSESEGRFELAERAARVVLTTTAPTSDDEAATPDLADQLRLDAALVGGRCAIRRGDDDAAALSFGAALRIEPQHREALAAAGEALYATGDAPAARELLERRIALDGAYSACGAHLAIIGEALELAGHDEDALARFEAALDREPALDQAHAGRVRCLERRADSDLAIRALEDWAAKTSEPAGGAAALRRAARLELDQGNEDAAASHLRQATERVPGCTLAWCELAELLVDRGDDEGALEAVQLQPAPDTADDLRVRLDRVRARAHERSGALEQAAAAWDAVVSNDPRDIQAALAHSRLLQRCGDWTTAADVLASFVARHPEPDRLELATVHLERGELLAGPLEDVEPAIADYERALVLDPSRSRARARLAGLLARVPGRRREAVIAHRELLRLEPATPDALRSLARIASEAGLANQAAFGESILGALGVSRGPQANRATPAGIARPLRLEDDRHEALRLAVREFAKPFGALQIATDEPTNRVGRTLAAISDELAAPRIDALSKSDLSTALLGAAALALDPVSPHAETPIAASLHAAAGRSALRRAQKRLRSQTLDDVSGIDSTAWRDELRGLAAAVALDRGECDLREVLTALIAYQRPDAETGDDRDLCALVSGSPAARALLTRVVMRWCERIQRAIQGDR